MIQTTIRQLKRNDFFTFKPKEECQERNVYVRGDYDPRTKKYWYAPYSNIMDERYIKADRDRGTISKAQYYSRLTKARETEQSILTSNF